jgi:uncharacterized protein YjiS (DUF1127 family)
MNAYVGRDEIAIQRSDYILRVEEEQLHFFARLGGFLHWLKEMPHRRAVMDELASLSDRGLKDIGLTRFDLLRAFDEDFVAERNGKAAD